MSRKKKKKSEAVSNPPPPPPVLPLKKKVLFSLVMVVSVFALLELGLRVARIGEPPTIGTLRFGYDTGIPIFDSDGIEREGEPFQDYPLFEADPVLFWKPIANTPFTGPEGFRLATPPSREKSPDVLRVGVIGDSCSFLGQDLYPNQFARLVTEASGRTVEVVNASCPGYTSQQGTRRLADLWPWQPDVIVVYFGWNDHWKSLNGQTDRDLMARQRLNDQAQSWLGMSRLVWTLYAIRAKLTPPVAVSQAPVRVPPQHYRENLQQILDECRQHGCKTVFITAPSAFLEGQVPDWAYQFFGEIYRMSPAEVAAIPQTHATYNDIVREVAGSSNSAMLLDIAGQWSSEEAIEKMPERFRGDRIHLTDAGHMEVGQQLYTLWKMITPNSDRRVPKSRSDGLR